jgi:hypothetical protein
LVPQDEERFVRWLEVIPDEVQEEYELRVKMFHGDGQSGPIGTAACIDILRFCGLKPVQHTGESEEVQRVDWKTQDSDGSVTVKAGPFYGEMQQGVFRGVMTGGMLAIELISEGRVVECRPDMVEFVSANNEPELEQAPLEPDARASLLEPEPPVDDEIADTDWSKEDLIDREVYVQRKNEEPVEGTFRGLDEEGRLRVKKEGAVRHLRCQPEEVVLA